METIIFNNYSKMDVKQNEIPIHLHNKMDVVLLSGIRNKKNKPTNENYTHTNVISLLYM